MPLSAFCDFTDDCGDFGDELFDVCLMYTRNDYEEDITGVNWANAANNDVNWVVYAPADDWSGSIPEFDHTTGISGHFLNMEADEVNEIKTGILLSPPFMVSTIHVLPMTCLRFKEPTKSMFSMKFAFSLFLR